MTGLTRRERAFYGFGDRACRSCAVVQNVGIDVQKWHCAGEVPTGREAGQLRRRLTLARKELEAAAADLDDWLTPDD